MIGAVFLVAVNDDDLLRGFLCSWGVIAPQMPHPGLGLRVQPDLPPMFR
jgi:hypothetical protein